MSPRCATIVLAVLVAAIAAAGAAPRASAPDAEHLDAMRLVDLDGRVWTAADLRGRVTLIDFWATWCGPCVTELPYLRHARELYAADELTIIGVSLDVIDRRSFISWINRRRVTWPQVYDGRGWNGSAARHFAVAAVPTSMLVDATGRIVARDLRGERLLDAIAQLVDRARS